MKSFHRHSICNVLGVTHRNHQAPPFKVTHADFLFAFQPRRKQSFRRAVSSFSDQLVYLAAFRHEPIRLDAVDLLHPLKTQRIRQNFIEFLRQIVDKSHRKDLKTSEWNFQIFLGHKMTANDSVAWAIHGQMNGDLHGRRERKRIGILIFSSGGPCGRIFGRDLLPSRPLGFSTQGAATGRRRRILTYIFL